MQMSQLHTLEILDSLIDKININYDIKVILGSDSKFSFQFTTRIRRGQTEYKTFFISIVWTFSQKMGPLWYMAYEEPWL